MSAAGAERARPRRRGQGWLFAGRGLLLAGSLAGYGIWPRSSTATALAKRTDDSAVPRVQVIAPKNGPKQRFLTLPGNIEAWYQANIYGPVAGYVSSWHKDYGAEVKAGDVLGTIETPSLDAELGRPRPSSPRCRPAATWP